MIRPCACPILPVCADYGSFSCNTAPDPGQMGRAERPPSCATEHECTHDAPCSNRSPYSSATPCTPTALLSLRPLVSIDGVRSLLHSYRHPTRNRSSCKPGLLRRALSRPGSDVVPRSLPCAAMPFLPCEKNVLLSSTRTTHDARIEHSVPNKVCGTECKCVSGQLH